MIRNSALLLAVSLLGLGTPRIAVAADPAVDRMRETLKNTALQLRAAETERATLQASQAELEQKNKTLTAQAEALTKQLAAAEKAAADNTGEATRLREALDKWRAAYEQSVEVGRTKEAERGKLAGEVISLKRVVADQKRKNAEMFRIGNEILTRYEKFGLGDALAAKEPFTGIARVKLEHLVQDYSDGLVDQRIKQ